MTAIVGVLSGRNDLTQQQLRWLEIAIFGIPVAFFTPYHYFCILQEAEAGNAVGVVAIFKNVASYWWVLLVIYGLYVPNTWQRAALVVTPMVLLPTLAGIAARFAHPLVAEHLGFQQLSDTLMVMCVVRC